MDENYKEKLEIFESYVNAGMKYLTDEVIKDDFKGLIKQIIEENRARIINEKEIDDLSTLKYL